MTQNKPTATIQFLKGIDETVIPEIRLSRSKDGRTGRALFIFEQPKALTAEQMGEIKGMFLIDEEGELVTREVNARFVNGKPNALEAIYIWKTEQDFERFMRFAKRYAKGHGMSYTDK